MNAPCAQYRDRIADAVTILPSPEERADLDRHLAGCESCREFQEGLLGDHQRLAELVGTLDGRLANLERRVAGMIETNALSAGTAAKVQESAGRRIAGIPRWLAGYAAAAVMAIGVFLIARTLLLPTLVPVAWADVLARVDATHGFICRWRAVIDTPQNVRIEGVHYELRRVGRRDDVFQAGRLMARNYLVPSTLERYSVFDENKSYFRIRLAPEEYDHLAMERNAREMLQLFKSYPHQEVGTMRIDGVDAPGIEILDPDFLRGTFDRARLRLWVDPRSNWPVRLEGDFEANQGGLREKVIMTDFQWEPALTTQDVEPQIPEDYALVLDLDAPGIDEDNAIEALRTYADLTSGRYPATLTWGAAATAPPGGFRQWGGDTPHGENFLERFLQIRSAIMFYVSLEKSGSDVAYHGDRVERTDFKAVLLRWKVEGGKYRVVYGDLRRETVDAARLARLEGGR